jgi:Zn-dependent peptidase ImmA (M78 family)
MPIQVTYPHHPDTGLPKALSPRAIRAVAAQLRAQLPGIAPDRLALSAGDLAGAVGRIEVNGRAVAVVWSLASDLFDDVGIPAYGACQADPDEPGVVRVVINQQMTGDRPDLAASTAAHELGHVVFDVPAMLGQPGRCYRSATTAAELDRGTQALERRANEFMGALLTPPVRLHTRLLAHARSEGLKLTRAINAGRAASPVLSRDNPLDAIAGVIAALAGDFGVSDRFIAVRLEMYGLIAGGRA